MARTTINASTSGNVGAFIFETLQGYGGIHVMPNEYLQKMTALTHEHGGLVLADEIQTGYVCFACSKATRIMSFRQQQTDVA